MVRLFRFLKEYVAKPTSRMEVGLAAEKTAAHFLKKHGLKLRAKQFRTRQGEIDLIMQDKNELVFVEVRYRAYEKYGLSKETVQHAKQQKIIRAAQYYLAQNPIYESFVCRFDVVALMGDIEKPEIEWVKDAFSM